MTLYCLSKGVQLVCCEKSLKSPSIRSQQGPLVGLSVLFSFFQKQEDVINDQDGINDQDQSKGVKSY